MGITINAEDIHDARHKLSMNEPRAAIRIRWRKSDDGMMFNYQALQQPGCIVEAVDFPGEDVPKSYATSAEALRYIASLLKRHDDYAREQKKKHEKEERKRIKEAAKKAQCR